MLKNNETHLKTTSNTVPNYVPTFLFRIYQTIIILIGSVLGIALWLFLFLGIPAIIMYIGVQLFGRGILINTD
jgi:hypothetical protein